MPNLTKTTAQIAFAVNLLLYLLVLPISFPHLTQAAGNTYYVSNSGSNSNSGSIGSPFQTINYGLTRLTPGDTLYVRGGTYNENISVPASANGSSSGASGSNWPNATKISGYPGETVWIAAGGSTVVAFPTGGTALAYQIWDHININGLNAADVLIYLGHDAHHIRWQNSELKNSNWSGINAFQGPYIEIKNNVIHDGDARCSGDAGHGIYISGFTGNATGQDQHDLIEGNNIYNYNCQSFDSGIQLYTWGPDADSLGGYVIRKNWLHDNGVGTWLGDAETVPIQFYNNIVEDNAATGVALYTRLAGTQIYNNTIYSNGDRGIELGAGSAATGILIKNNAIADNSGGPITILNADSRSSATIQYNDINGNGSNNINDQNGLSVINNNITTPPGFANPGANDFTISGGNLVNAGTTLGTVADDYVGTSRPFGPGYDIGAYESTTGSATPTPPPPPSQTPIAWWKFDGNASDSTGNNLNGTLRDSPTFTTGRINSALHFDGINDWVEVANNNILNVTSNFSISAWVNPDVAATDYRTILIKDYYSLYGSGEANTYINGTACPAGAPLGGLSTGTSDRVACASPTLPANTWTHLATTYDGSTIKLYRNGALAASTSYTGPIGSSTGPLQIGASQYGEYFRGSIDDVQLYNRALSLSEIQTLYNTASAAPLPGDLNLDHIVNSIDWSVMNSKWFTSDANADLNHDGIVNAIDYSTLNANWFKTW